MRIVQATWVRYHHFDLARELQGRGHLERIFTSLPWWKVEKEACEQQIPRQKISSNFLVHGLRRLFWQVPGVAAVCDAHLGILETKHYSRWVARHIPECDAFIGISGAGLHAGRVAKSRGAGYIMDRGSTQVRHANTVLAEEHRRWGVPWTSIHPWLIENEEAEALEANIITVPSSFVRDTFVNTGTPREKLRVVPYGVSLSEFYPVGVGPPDDSFCLLFVGQFSIRKGALYLLEAFKAFKHPRKRLIVVGSVAPELLPAIRTMNVEQVTFAGVVSRTEVKKHLAMSHALVLPSIEEGLALVQGQALACGRPVIATPNTGSETLFTHEREGLIVKAQDSVALTAAFERLAADPTLRQSMGAAALQRAQELGGWGLYADGMLHAAAEAKQLAMALSK